MQRQGQKSSKNIAICDRVENTVFCDVFSTRGFTCTANATVFFQFSKQTSQKHWYLQCFDKTTCKKTRCFETIFHNFSAHAPPFKIRSFFTLLFPPLIRTQEGVKSGQIAKLHLNSTFCLSQSLRQSCNTKNWGRLSGPQNAVHYDVFERTMHSTCKKRCPPQLKLTVLVPPERHAFLHLRCGADLWQERSGRDQADAAELLHKAGYRLLMASL